MKPRYKVVDVEAALRKTGGLISPAARILEAAYGSCTPATVRNYVRRHPTLQASIEEITETTLDLAENKLVQAINNDNLTAIIFFLKTKGKSRGYVERHEVGGKDGQPIIVRLDGADKEI